MPCMVSGTWGLLTAGSSGCSWNESPDDNTDALGNPGERGDTSKLFPQRGRVLASCGQREKAHGPLLLGNNFEGGLGDAWIRDAVGIHSRARDCGDLRSHNSGPEV